MRQRLLKSASPGNLFSSLLEMKEFASNLPRRINRLLETAANNELEVKVDAIDERLLIEGLPEDRQPHHDGPGAGRPHRGRGDVDERVHDRSASGAILGSR